MTKSTELGRVSVPRKGRRCGHRERDIVFVLAWSNLVSSPIPLVLAKHVKWRSIQYHVRMLNTHHDSSIPNFVRTGYVHVNVAQQSPLDCSIITLYLDLSLHLDLSLNLYLSLNLHLSVRRLPFPYSPLNFCLPATIALDKSPSQPHTHTPQAHRPRKNISVSHQSMNGNHPLQEFSSSPPHPSHSLPACSQHQHQHPPHDPPNRL